MGVHPKRYFELFAVKYGVGEAWKIIGAGGEETGAAGAVTRAAGARAMTLGEDVPSAVTAVWVRFVLEPPPRQHLLLLPQV